jgi:integrase
MPRTPGPRLFQRHQAWFVTYYIPRAQQGLIGRREVTRTLGTHSKRDAVLRMPAVVDRIQRELTVQIDRAAVPISDPASILANAQRYRMLVTAGEITPEAAGEALEHDVDAHLGHYREMDPDTGGQITPETLPALVAHAHRVASDLGFKTLKEWGDERLSEAKAHLALKTHAAKRTALALLVNHFGALRDPRSISVTEAGGFVRERIISNAKWSLRTKESRLQEVREFFNWLDRPEQIGDIANPFRRSAIPRGRQGREKTRRGFAPHELETLLLSDWPMPYLSAVTLIALYSGARLEEICACATADLIGDAQAFNVRKAKNSNSVRVIPLHPIVQPLAKKLRDTSWDGFLLSGLKVEQGSGKRSHRVTVAFGQWKRRIGLTDPQTVFHSFRNTFITAAERAGLHREQVSQLVGHAPQSMGARYVDSPELQRLSEFMAMISHGSRIDSIATALANAHAGNAAKEDFKAQSYRPVPSSIAHLFVKPSYE